MNNNKVYLAGPIGGLTVNEATDWRHRATYMLAKHGLDAYSPMRSKNFINDGQPLSSVPNTS
ncbi:hypothetical protein, partial [Enterococcus faecium]